MSTVTHVEKIRLVIAEQLVRFGAQRVESMREAILIRDGMFCGRRFQCDGYEVVWFIEEDEIKFFSPCAELLLATSALACVATYESRRDQDQIDAAPCDPDRLDADRWDEDRHDEDRRRVA